MFHWKFFNLSNFHDLGPSNGLITCFTCDSFTICELQCSNFIHLKVTSCDKTANILKMLLFFLIYLYYFRVSFFISCVSLKLILFEVNLVFKIVFISFMFIYSLGKINIIIKVKIFKRGINNKDIVKHKWENIKW